MEEVNEGLSMMRSINLIVVLVTIVMMGFHLIRTYREVNGEPETYLEQTQYNIITAIMVGCGLTALTYFMIDGDWIYGIIWSVNAYIWYWNLGNTKKGFDAKRDRYNQTRPTTPTESETPISDELDRMLEEAKRDELNGRN